MTSAAFFIDLPLDLIQALRLAHALAEGGFRLHVSAEDAPKLMLLGEIFGLSYTIGGEGIPVLSGLAVDHMKPETRIGAIVRPLIMPVAAFDYCRRRWPRKRKVRASFPGVPTESRRKVINEWLATSRLRLRVPASRQAASHRSLLNRISRRLGRRFGLRPREQIRAEGVKIVFSDEGRVFPRKAWNVEYYSWLLESEFVLCPDGDYGKDGVAWTYRFFESILCGAIPVVENTCAAYEGFRFRRMSEPLGTLAWSAEDAEFNFALARERLTVPRDQIRAEVQRLLAISPAQSPGTSGADSSRRLAPGS